MAPSRNNNDNGIVNPSGGAIAGAGVLYLAFVPVTTWITRPGGIIQSIAETVLSPVVGTAAVGSRMIPALSALYVFWTFGGSGAVSAAGQAMARPEGLDDEHPRKYIDQLDGFPLRLRSAHYALMENFPSFALAAALAQSLAPADQQVINLLTFHVFAKLFVHYPSYLLNVVPPRTLAHIFSIASVINVCWRLATGGT